MSNGEDERFRSRKWRLAVASLALATIAATVLEVVVGAFLWKGLLTEDIWLKAATGVLYWWLFVDAAVLSGYGIANVVEKWSPAAQK